MPSLDPIDLALLAVVALSALLAGLALARARRGWRSRARNRMAQRGERDAEKVLRKAGYRIEARQVTGRWTLLVDGEPVEVSCRADLIVRRRRRRYVAEVKSGEEVANPTRPGTRRQLLEYRHAFDVHGVLLVDMVRNRVHEVRFQHDRR